jgi:hypothetical protein
MARKNKQFENDPIAQALFDAEMQQREEDWDDLSVDLTEVIYRNMRWGIPNIKRKDSGGTNFRLVGDVTDEPDFFQKLAA